MFKKPLTTLNILAAILLIIALGNLPYNYYVFLRWIIFLVAAYNVRELYNHEYVISIAVFVLIALIFNPILPFYLTKSSWNVWDIIAAVLFIYPFILFKKNNDKITETKNI